MEVALSVCSPLEGSSTFLVSCTLRLPTKANNTALPQLQALHLLRKGRLEPVNPGSALEGNPMQRLLPTPHSSATPVEHTVRRPESGLLQCGRN